MYSISKDCWAHFVSLVLFAGWFWRLKKIGDRDSHGDLQEERESLSKSKKGVNQVNQRKSWFYPWAGLIHIDVMTPSGEGYKWRISLLLYNILTLNTLHCVVVFSPYGTVWDSLRQPRNPRGTGIKFLLPDSTTCLLLIPRPTWM